MVRDEDQAVRVRAATLADMPAITAIYAHHVLHGFGTFEEVPPTVTEMTERFQSIIAAGYPYFVAESAGRQIGYAYASAFRARSGYRFTVEDSVYVAADAPRRGIGRALMTRLIDACRAAGFRQMLAVIGDTGNAGSIGLHRAMGFIHAGTCPDVGFKLGRWVDMVIMRRDLAITPDKY